MSSNDWYSTSNPRSVKGGIKPAGTHKGFATTWCGKRWIEVLESFHIGQILQRGRKYARAGQVMEIDIKGSKISALVQGQRLTPYEVIIEFRKWDEETKLKVRDIILSSGYLLGPILARELPRELEFLLVKKGIDLFPNRYEELKTSCTCPDCSNPCKHIAAVSYLLALEFDRNPTLIFQLRGMSITDIKRSIDIDDESFNKKETIRILAEEQRNIFLKLLKDNNFSLGEVNLSFLELVPKTPPVDALNIKRLGVPPFWRSDVDFLEIMVKLYRHFSECGKNKVI